MVKKLALLFVLLLALATAAPALAQTADEGLRLRISKVIGYGSFGNNEFQGTIKIWTEGPEDLAQVTFYIDGEVMNVDAEAPFELVFNTASYSLGAHTMVAVGTTAGGQELRSNEINTSFVTPERGWQAALKIGGPLIIIVALISLIGLAGPVLLGRGKKVDLPMGASRKYGTAGGAICPRCARPFPLRVFALNVSPVHRFDRCPYCGKWAVMRRRSEKDLRAAEAAELVEARKGQLGPVETEEEKLRKELDSSRYQDF